MELESASTEKIRKAEYTHEPVLEGDIKVKKVLVPVDFSENSSRAVDYVAAFAANTDTEITLFYVWRKIEFGPEDKELGELEELMEEDIRGWLMIYRERLEEVGVDPARISTKYTTRGYTRAGEILKEAVKGGYGTIVMGMRGSSTKGHEPYLGRVTNSVLSQADGFAVCLVP